MAVEKETREIYRCDVCGRRSELPLTGCPICGKEVCYPCSHQLYDVWHTNICKKCLEDENVNAYFMDSWKHWGKERGDVVKEMQGRYAVSQRH